MASRQLAAASRAARSTGSPLTYAVLLCSTSLRRPDGAGATTGGLQLRTKSVLGVLAALLVGVAVGWATAPDGEGSPISANALAAEIEEETSFPPEVARCVADRSFAEFDAQDVRDLYDGGPPSLGGSPLAQRYAWIVVGCQSASGGGSL